MPRVAAVEIAVIWTHRLTAEAPSITADVAGTAKEATDKGKKLISC